MKAMKKINYLLTAFMWMAVAAGLWACTADPAESSRGKQPDKNTLGNTYAKIRSMRSAASRGAVAMTEGNATATDRMFCLLTTPAEKAMQFVLTPDAALVDEFNAANGTEFEALPPENIVIENGGVMSVAAGERLSDKITVKFMAEGLAAGEYLMPFAASGDMEFEEGNGVFYYMVSIRGISVFEKYELDTEYMNVFYLNTSIYQPLLADVWLLEKMDFSDGTIVWERTYGNIVNLRIVQIGYDQQSGRAMLMLGDDMQYVLEHADKYIRPLQDKGRKVCLCLEGGSTGVGFCNLSDSQIADFVSQVKACVEHYGLDGVNFFDRYAGYGKEGMPPMNTTSYPKLIKAMREALGNEMLVTLADYEEPTEYFWDTNATGGIAVGEWIDYAWSGYMSESEGPQLLDPWNIIDPNDPAVAEVEQKTGWVKLTYPTNVHPRKPIAGLTKDRYGHFAISFYHSADLYKYDSGFANIGVWSYVGWAPNNIVVWADLISNSQGKYEGAATDVPSTVWYYISPEAIDNKAMYRIWANPVYLGRPGGIEYDYLKKDW